ncbi:hypothetical protein [Trichormus azollae]|uniref:hypothetical protein n=1 Tax=Trichormus azollae TaxID=1164 RepID=UPI003B83411B
MYIGGSFLNRKTYPKDFDLLWFDILWDEKGVDFRILQSLVRYKFTWRWQE